MANRIVRCFSRLGIAAAVLVALAAECRRGQKAAKRKVGPELPVVAQGFRLAALHQIGSYLAYTGRSASAFGKAAHDRLGHHPGS
jgi:hypothetical protein